MLLGENSGGNIRSQTKRMSQPLGRWAMSQREHPLPRHDGRYIAVDFFPCRLVLNKSALHSVSSMVDPQMGGWSCAGCLDVKHSILIGESETLGLERG